MKHFVITFFLGSFFGNHFVVAQKDYPVPEFNSSHIFYVQHSKNHNTYVYDANMLNGHITQQHPINSYRVMYTNGGVIKPLTSIQKTMAYGIEASMLQKNLFKFHFAASNKLPFFLTLQNNTPKVYVSVNGIKIWLNRIFIMLKNKGIGIDFKVDYILLYGKDFLSNKDTVLKYYPS